MTLTDVEIVGFRSVRKLRLPLRQLTVLVGGNGVGKTNLYRSLELLQAAAKGTLADEIAREGGLGSIFWAGGKNLSPGGGFDPKYRSDGYRRGEPNRLMLEASLTEVREGFDPAYRIEIGFPPKNGSAAFVHEAWVKEEHLEMRRKGKPVELMDRKGNVAFARDAEGRRELASDAMLASETALATLGQSEVAAVRREFMAWRFFHGFRSDPDSPLRRPSRALTSPLLNSDGSNLAAVFATLRFIREESIDLDAAVDAAFPGARLEVPRPEDFATFAMTFPETSKRAFEAHELSDGTLKFLALMGALHSYRLPPFIALNEPETSLHPGLLPALAGSIVKAAERAQVWVVTHSVPLAEAIADQSGVTPREVIRTDDGTTISGLNGIGLFDDE